MRPGLFSLLKSAASKLVPPPKVQEFLDQHFVDTDPDRWKAFKKKLVSPTFVDAIGQDERADRKLRRYAENNGRHVQARGVPTYKVPSQSSSRSYTVKYHPSIGHFSCNCGDWVHVQSTKNKGADCKHIKQLKRELQSAPKTKQAAARGAAAGVLLTRLLAAG